MCSNFSYVAADKPEYHKGHAVMIALNSLSFVCKFSRYKVLITVTWVMIFWLSRENKKLDKLAAEGANQFPYSSNRMNGDLVEISATGHAPERFRYII